MYPNSQQTFFLTSQQQPWRVIRCLGKYSFDPTGYGDAVHNGHVPPLHEMIRFPTGKYTEGAPKNYGSVVNIFEFGVFGAMATYVVTERQILKYEYDPNNSALANVYNVPKGYFIIGKIAGDTGEHRYFVAKQTKDNFAGILFFRGEEWVLAESEGDDLADFNPVHFAPSYTEGKPSIITFANCSGDIKQYWLDEICMSLLPKKQPQEEVVLLEPVEST